MLGSHAWQPHRFQAQPAPLHTWLLRSFHPQPLLDFQAPPPPAEAQRRAASQARPPRVLEEGCAGEPQRERVRIDQPQHANARRRITEGDPTQRAGGKLTAAEHKGRVEDAPTGSPVLDVDREPLTWERRVAEVRLIHAQKRRDVEGLGEAPVTARNYIAVPLSPWGVGHLGEQRLDLGSGLLEAVVEADGVKAVAEGAQVGEQSHRARRSPAELVLDPLADRLIKRLRPVPEVIAAAEANQTRAAGDQPPVEEPGQLGEVDVGERDPMAEFVARLHAPVTDAALVDAAGGAHSRTLNGSPGISPSAASAEEAGPALVRRSEWWRLSAGNGGRMVAALIALLLRAGARDGSLRSQPRGAVAASRAPRRLPDE